MNTTQLLALQKYHDLSDIEMSQKLGISREYYNRVKNNKLPFTPKLSLKIKETFPENFLNMTSTEVVSSTTTPEKPQNGKSGLLRRLFNRVMHRRKNKCLGAPLK